MRLLIISGTLPDVICGVGVYTLQLAKVLTKLGVEVAIITSDSPLIKKESGIEIIPVIKKWDFFALPTILKIFKEYNPDIVHIQHPTAIRGKISSIFYPLIFRFVFPRKPVLLRIDLI